MFPFLLTTVFGQVSSPTPIDSVDNSNSLLSASSGLGIWKTRPLDSGSTDWQKIQLWTNPIMGQLELHTNRYTELANNLNFTNEVGVLERSVDVIMLMTNTGGAAALKSQTKVYFPPTLGDSSDFLTIVSPGTTVKLQPVALYYFDAQSGKSVLLASAQPADGELVAVNRVVYKSIFKGCDLRLTYTKGAFESDLIMLARPNAPETYGLNSAYTRLELWHAVYGPAPQQTLTVLDSITNISMVQPNFIDATLDFADLHFPQGRAFSWNGQDEQSSFDVPAEVHRPTPGLDEVIVAKRYDHLGDRPALVESVRWSEIEPYLESLPLMSQNGHPSNHIQRASLEREVPLLAEKAQTNARPMQVALGGYKANGFVWDYTTVSGNFSTYIFYPGTYYISSAATFSSSVSFASDCYLKFANNAYLEAYSSCSVNCSGSSSNPSVLTSMHDNGFGEQIAGSTGNLTYSANPALWLYQLSTGLSHMKIRWAQTGVKYDASGGTGNAFSFSSLEWCQTGIWVNNAAIALQTSTECSVGTPVTGTGSWSTNGTLSNICNGNDSNGLPLSWEYEYFGSSGINLNGDADLDGLSNQQEYSHQTNPQVSDVPLIIGEPQNQLAVVGNTATFGVNATGTGSLTYQWYKAGQAISGATNSSYSITNVQLVNCGYYFVLITNTVGSPAVTFSTTSSEAFLSVAAPTNGVPIPSGAVAWWPANGNANDAIGTNTGTLLNSATYAAGEVSQAFSFTGSTDYMQALDSPSLNQTNAMTLECWVYVAAYSANNSVLVIGKDGTSVHEYQITLVNTSGHWWFRSLFSTGGGNLTYVTGTTVPQLNTWYHVAMTYDGLNFRQYVNGVADGGPISSGAIAPTADPFLIGGYGTGPWTFNGRVDEATLYNRALSQAEVQSVYNAGGGGKYLPPLPPQITSQPQSQVVAAGSNVTFSVGVLGASPLTYQWLFNGAAISGATSNPYTISNAQSGNVGNYSVVVANPGGSTLSSTASLSLLGTGACTSPPTNMISWWRAENNANDTVSTNSGQMMGAATYAGGEVAQAFSFNGASGCYVQIPSNASLQLSNAFTIEFWYKDNGNSGWYGLVAKRSATSPYPCNFGINANGSGNYMQVYFLDPTTSSSFQISTITPLPSANTFHHLAAVYQQTTSTNVQIQTYIDGTLMVTSTRNGKLGGTFDNSPVTIGSSTTNGEWFNGWIDEVSIYNRALSATEIQAIHNSGIQGKCFDVYNPWLVEWGGNTPPAPPGMGRATMIDGGLNFNVALLNDGTVNAWGDNTYGQTSIPPLFTPVKSIAAAWYQAAAVQANGQVVAWGQTYGQIPSNLNNATSVSVGWAHGIALRSDGTVSTWGDSSDSASTNYPGGLTGVAAVAAGWEHNVALLTNGTVVSWGDNGGLFGWNVTVVPQGLTNVTAIAGGAYHTLALKSNGTVVAWGAGSASDNSFAGYGQSIVPSGLSNVVAIAAGGYSSMALRNDGSVVCWGQFGPAPTGLNNVLAFGVSDEQFLAQRIGRETPLILTQPQNQCALAGQTASFTAVGFGPSSVTYQWQFNGANISGATNSTYTMVNVQSGNQGTNHAVISNSAGSIVSQDATLNLIGSPVVAYQSPTVPVQLLYGSNITLSVIATNSGVCPNPISYNWFLNGNPYPYAVPNGTNLTLLTGSNGNSGNYVVAITNQAGSNYVSFNIDVAGEGHVVWWGNMSQPWNYLSSITNVLGLAGGGNHALLVEDGGTVVAWGTNTYGQTNVPSWLTNASAVAAGDAHSLALRTDGTVVGWGRNDFQQTNVPTGLTNIIAISAGGQQSLALSNNGSIVQWGQTFASPPANITARAIASGTNFHMALLTNGTVTAWGNNSNGQLNVPASATNVVAIAARGAHALALKSNGTVVAWGSNGSGESTVPTNLTNVMAIAAGYSFSLALSNNGTLTAWGDNSVGQTNIPLLPNPNMKLIAAGGYQTFASIFSPVVQYQIDVSKDLLLVYNSNSTDSQTVLNYYLQHRPMVSNANVLAIQCTNYGAHYETVSPTEFTTQIAAPITSWLSTNQTKRPQYVILFLDVPSRLSTLVTSATNFPYYDGPYNASVSFLINSLVPAWQPFVTHINMDGTNDCIAYINKLVAIGSNNSSSRLLLSASANGYGNTNYYFDDTNFQYPGAQWGFSGAQGVIRSGVSSNSVIYTNVNPDPGPGLSGHITRGTNVAGYFSWGFHSWLGNFYVTNSPPTVQWTGNSPWYIVATAESYNGQRVFDPPYYVGNKFIWLFTSGAFGGTNYSNTPVGTISYTDEPALDQGGVANFGIFYGLWAQEKTFASCAWVSRATIHFQAVGDPFVTR